MKQTKSVSSLVNTTMVKWKGIPAEEQAEESQLEFTKTAAGKT